MFPYSVLLFFTFSLVLNHSSASSNHSCCDFECVADGIKAGITLSQNISQFRDVFVLNNELPPKFVYMYMNISWMSCENTSISTLQSDLVWGDDPVIAVYGPTLDMFASQLLFDPVMQSIFSITDSILGHEKTFFFHPWRVSDSLRLSIEVNDSCVCSEFSNKRITSILKLVLKNSEQIAAASSSYLKTDNSEVYLVDIQDSHRAAKAFEVLHIMFMITMILLNAKCALALFLIVKKAKISYLKNMEDKKKIMKKIRLLIILVGYSCGIVCAIRSTLYYATFKYKAIKKFSKFSFALFILDIVCFGVSASLFMLSCICKCFCKKNKSKNKLLPLNLGAIIPGWYFSCTICLMIIPLVVHSLILPLETISFSIQYCLVLVWLLCAWSFFLWLCQWIFKCLKRFKNRDKTQDKTWDRIWQFILQNGYISLSAVSGFGVLLCIMLLYTMGVSLGVTNITLFGLAVSFSFSTIFTIIVYLLPTYYENVRTFLASVFLPDQESLVEVSSEGSSDRSSEEESLDQESTKEMGGNRKDIQ